MAGHNRNRFDADQGSGFRSNAADFGATASTGQRGGTGDLPGNPQSSPGFRRAIKSAGHSGNRLSGQLPNKVSFGGRGYRKPNYFAQGGKRHGLHISTGAPHTGPATQEGSDAGGGA